MVIRTRSWLSVGAAGFVISVAMLVVNRSWSWDGMAKKWLLKEEDLVHCLRFENGRKLDEGMT